jgi:subtilisin family serine protease
MKKILFTSALLLSGASILNAQKAPINWYLQSFAKDGVFGTGTTQAYEYLNGMTPQTVIVAVIDSGVEVDHEDLKGVIWTNKNEIPDNGIDDDKNGYVDDIHGWSFLGGPGGDIDHEAMEVARLYHNARRIFEGKDASKLSGKELDDYNEYLKLKEDFQKEQSEIETQEKNLGLLSGYIRKVKDASNGEFSKKTNKAYVPKDEMEKRIQKRVSLILLAYEAKDLDGMITEGAETYMNMAKYNGMNTDSLRHILVGDDPSNGEERFYGCNRYEGPDAMHGTHVSGIIAAQRGNGIGIDGIAANAQIMVLRAVPNGDERDKDVANAIRYAVDNGAKVINMSFGKYFYQDKALVDAAIRYAMDNDVLLVHAAGNDAKDKDVEDSYPTRRLSDGTIASNWIEVGAASVSKKGSKLLADFSNYGLTTVDLFAPGVDIYSTVPDGKYEDASGTSMACPATAGVCAIIRGYFPELTAAQVREVLMKTAVPCKKKVVVPGTKKKVKVTDVSISGGFVSAEKAVEYLLLIR